MKNHAVLTSASILVVGSDSSTVVDEGTVVQQKCRWTLDIKIYNIDDIDIIIDEVRHDNALQWWWCLIVSCVNTGAVKSVEVLTLELWKD